MAVFFLLLFFTLTYISEPIIQIQLSEKYKVPKTLFEARKVAGSATGFTKPGLINYFF